MKRNQKIVFKEGEKEIFKTFIWEYKNMFICLFLSGRVLKKMGFQISKGDIDCIINAQPDAVERVLRVVQIKLDKYIDEQKKKKDQQ